MTSTNTKASTLAELEERLQQIENEPFDASSYPLIAHRPSGLSFRVVPMSLPSYRTWLDLRFIEDRQHEESGAKEKKAPLHRPRSDAFLLEHAVCSEGGQELSPALAKSLLDGKGFGPATQALCEAAAFVNPPREELARPAALSFGFSRALVVLVGVLQEAGLFEMLRERAQGEQASNLTTWEETLPFWQLMLDAPEAAREIGIGQAQTAPEEEEENAG